MFTETSADAGREQRALVPQSPESAAPRGWAAIWYLREATRIARFDAEAIARVSQDRNALFYGGCVLGVGALASYLNSLPTSALTIPWSTLSAAAILAVFLRLVNSALSVAITHALGKFLLGATGNYLAVLRVLWLGFIVSWLEIVPLVGWLAAVVWGLLVMLVTFEEVDGVERLEAMGLAVGAGIIMRLAEFVLR